MRLDFELNKSVQKRFFENLSDWAKIVAVGVSVLASIYMIHKFMFCSWKADKRDFKRKSL